MLIKTAVLATALAFTPLVLQAQTEASPLSAEAIETKMTEPEIFAASVVLTLIIMLGSGVLGRSARIRDRRF